MAGMKRFVTYIYSYENKLKGGNAGFARFEIRGEECRIEIHLRGIGGRTVCKIYFFLLENGEMVGFEIGEIGIMNGSGDYRAMIPAGQICGSPFSVFDMEGIVFFSDDDRMFLSRWKEGKRFEAAKEYFHVWKPKEALKDSIPDSAPKKEKRSGTEVPNQSFLTQREQTAEQKEAEQKSGAAEQKEAERQGNAAERQSKAAEQKETERQSRAAEQKEAERQSNAAEQKKMTQQHPSEQIRGQETKTKGLMPIENDPVENVTATELPMRNVFPQYTWQEIWESLLAGRPVYEPFENENIQCIRIELKDLRELPRQYWYLGNNSFLLHGFFNYHYLILGRQQNHYFIGVPGIFQRQEHVMAAVFGFPEFKPIAPDKKEGVPQASFEEEKSEPVNRFGFWSRYME